MTDQNLAHMAFDETSATFFCKNRWTITTLESLHQQIKTLSLPTSIQQVKINGSQIQYLDSAGALSLDKIIKKLHQNHIDTQLDDFNDHQLALLQQIQTQKEDLVYQKPEAIKKHIWQMIGEETYRKLHQAQGLMALIGDTTLRFKEAFSQWHKFHGPAIAVNIENAGVKALPIIALLSFLIGIVLAYQMGLQLQTYGANIYIAYLSGLAIFREFSPLITAIIVAGRTSSAFTAQIGSMKINEEIDALLTMGLSPTELLVIPKIIGLLIVFPLLIFWSDFFSIIGSMFMSKIMLNVGYQDFLVRLRESVGTDQLMLGIYKAPAFALIVALVGCFQGFAVKGSSDSIGLQTTKSVVQALFLIIVADAVYSVIYSWMNL